MVMQHTQANKPAHTRRLTAAPTLTTKPYMAHLASEAAKVIKGDKGAIVLCLLPHNHTSKTHRADAVARVQQPHSHPTHDTRRRTLPTAESITYTAAVEVPRLGGYFLRMASLSAGLTAYGVKGQGQQDPQCQGQL